MKSLSMGKLSQLAMVSLLGGGVSCAQLQTGVTGEDALPDSAQKVGNLAQVGRVAALAVIDHPPEQSRTEREPVLCATTDNTLIGLQTVNGQALRFACKEQARERKTKVIEVRPYPEFEIVDTPNSGAVLNITLTTSTEPHSPVLEFAALTTGKNWTTLSTALSKWPADLLADISCGEIFVPALNPDKRPQTRQTTHVQINLANSDPNFAITCSDQGQIQIAVQPILPKEQPPQNLPGTKQKNLQTLNGESDLTISTKKTFGTYPLHPNYADYEEIHTFLRTEQRLGKIPDSAMDAGNREWADFLIAQKEEFFGRYWYSIPNNQLPEDDKFTGSVSVSLNSHGKESDYYGVEIKDMCIAFQKDLSPKTFQTLFKKLPNGNYWPNMELLKNEKQLEKLLLADEKFKHNFFEAAQVFLYNSPAGYFMSCGGNALLRIAKFQKHSQAQGFGAPLGNFYNKDSIGVIYQPQSDKRQEHIEATFSCGREKADNLIRGNRLSLNELAQRRAADPRMGIPVPLYSAVVEPGEPIHATCDERGVITFSNIIN